MRKAASGLLMDAAAFVGALVAIAALVGRQPGLQPPSVSYAKPPLRESRYRRWRTWGILSLVLIIIVAALYEVRLRSKRDQIQKISSHGVELYAEIESFYSELIAALQRINQLEGALSSLRGVPFDPQLILRHIEPLESRRSVAAELLFGYAELGSLVGQDKAGESEQTAAGALLRQIEPLPGTVDAVGLALRLSKAADEYERLDAKTERLRLLTETIREVLAVDVGVPIFEEKDTKERAIIELLMSHRLVDTDALWRREIEQLGLEPSKAFHVSEDFGLAAFSLPMRDSAIRHRVQRQRILVKLSALLAAHLEYEQMVFSRSADSLDLRRFAAPADIQDASAAR